MRRPMGILTLLTAGQPPRDIALNKPRITIGRRSRCDIRFDDQAVSAEHAVILQVGADAVLEDLDSTNGTCVNGQPVKKHFLQDGDVVDVAGHRLVYHAHAAGPGAWEAGVPVLEVAGGKNAGSRTPLTKAITVVGGGDEPGLLILRRGRDYLLVPETETQVVTINGLPVASDERRLANGDVIRLPHIELHFLHPFPRRG